MHVFDPADLRKFRSLVEEHLGLSFDQVREDELAPLLADRVEETGSRTFSAYWRRLESRALREEMRVLAQRLSVGETFFFRQKEHFEAFRDQALPFVIERHRTAAAPVRILSAGCSSGEEPYTLSMVILDALGSERSRAPKIHIDAIDISTAALDKARRGRYSDWSLRSTPPVSLARYFEPQGREFVLSDEVRASVAFQERSLVEDEATFWAAARYGVIFCRNVIMYFSREAARAIVARLARALAPDGFLFLGHAETLRGLSQDFHLCHTHDTFYYRRHGQVPSPSHFPCDSSSSEPSLDGDAWVDSIARASERVTRLTSATPPVPWPEVADSPRPSPAPPALTVADPPRPLDPALDFMAQERYDDALASLQTLEADADVLLMRTALLTNRGDLRQAEALCHRILAQDELNAGAHYLLALCRDHSGDGAGAEQHYRVAIYLDAEFAMPRLHLGMALRRRKRSGEAERELREALPLLAREDSSRILLLGGGFGRDMLMKLCANELRACGGTL